MTTTKNNKNTSLKRKKKNQYNFEKSAFPPFPFPCSLIPLLPASPAEHEMDFPPSSWEPLPVDIAAVKCSYFKALPGIVRQS